MTLRSRKFGRFGCHRELSRWPTFRGDLAKIKLRLDFSRLRDFSGNQRFPEKWSYFNTLVLKYGKWWFQPKYGWNQQNDWGYWRKLPITSLPKSLFWDLLDFNTLVLKSKDFDLRDPPVTQIGGFGSSLWLDTYRRPFFYWTFSPIEWSMAVGFVYARGA